MRDRTLDEMNTDSNGPERIWVNRQFASMWFNHNDQRKENTIEKTMLFLEHAKAKAWSEHYVQVVVRPVASEGDDCSLGQEYLVVEGWREETDAEYQKRLKDLINREKHEKKMFDMKKAYFDNNGIDKKFWLDHDQHQGEFGFGSGHEKRVAELEKALKKV